MSDLLIVPRPEHVPGHCVLSLKSEDPEGFIDTGLNPSMAFADDMDPHIYASVSVVKEWARKLGMVDPADPLELDNLRRECLLLRDQLADADKRLDAIDLLESAGYTQRKKPGRPRNV